MAGPLPASSGQRPLADCCGPEEAFHSVELQGAEEHELERVHVQLPSSSHGAGIMAVWQVALVKQLRIMGSNPSQLHILAEGRRKAEEWRKAMGERTGFSAP